MNASVAIQTLPEAKNDDELIRIVDEVIDYIKSTGLNYYVGPFETAIEGDYDELMDIVKECQHIAIRAGAPSVLAYIKVTYKPEGDVLTIEHDGACTLVHAAIARSGRTSFDSGLSASAKSCGRNAARNLHRPDHRYHRGLRSRGADGQVFGYQTRALSADRADADDPHRSHSTSACALVRLRDAAENHSDSAGGILPHRCQHAGRLSVG